jgi:geranylgeranyl diphosphate synthase type I
MLDKIIKDTNVTLARFLKNDPSLKSLKRISPMLVNGIKDFAGRPGKRIRPALFTTSYLGYSKKTGRAYNKVIKASLSLELLHNFLLIHDDIIDNADLRRRKPTLHRIFNESLSLGENDKLGYNLGIVAGDIIFALAVNTLNAINEAPERKQKAMELFASAATLTGAGEFIDVVNNIKPLDIITEKQIYNTYILKTAKYTFEIPLLIGGTLAGAGHKEIKKLSDTGILLGQAFQILDDMLDIFSTRRKSGKPVLSDLSEGKKTLIALKTYHLLKEAEKSLFKQLFEKKNKKKTDIIKIKQLIEKSGAKYICLKKVSLLLKKSESVYSTLRIKEQYKKALYDIIQKLNENLKEFNSGH